MIEKAEQLMANATKSRVILRGVSGTSISSKVEECLAFCDWERWVGRNATLVIKPNLCSAVPGKTKMSNTDLALTTAVCEALLTRTNRIQLVESDALRHKAQDAFAASGYLDLARRLGLQTVNLSEATRTRMHCEPAGEIELPRLLLEADVLITLPVLKTHALTYFTGALKNQWGCLPQYDRILFHKFLDELIVTLHRVLRPRFALMDGIIAMEGRGPTNGKPRRLDVILASQDSVALDATAMRLVGLEPTRARHVVLAAKQSLGAIRTEEIEVDGDWEQHATQFEPAILDTAIAAMNYMSRYRWFVKYALEKDYVFYPVRAGVQLLRRMGVVEGGN